MNLRRLIIFILFMFVFFGSCETQAGEIKKGNSGLIFNAEYKKAWVKDMYTQIPRGGNPNATSNKRPDKNDIGLDSINIPAFFLSYRLNAHELKLGSTFIYIEESFTLDKPLRFHGQDYFPGIEYKFKQDLNFYSLNYSYDLTLDNFKFKPAIEIGLFDFMVNIEDEFGKDNRRNFSREAFRAGGNIMWDLTDSFYLSGQAMYAIPIPNSFYYSDLSLKGGFRFSVFHIPEISIEAGLQYLYIEFKDNQDKPNNILLDLFPALSVGVCLKF